MHPSLAHTARNFLNSILWLCHRLIYVVCFLCCEVVVVADVCVLSLCDVTMSSSSSFCIFNINICVRALLFSNIMRRSKEYFCKHWTTHIKIWIYVANGCTCVEGLCWCCERWNIQHWFFYTQSLLLKK